MDRVLLHDAVRQLEALVWPLPGQSGAPSQAISQFNALLKVTKSLYPDRADIQALKGYEESPYVTKDELIDAVRRLRSALDLRPPGSSVEVLAQIQLPQDAPEDLALDMRELKGAISLGLTKTALLLAGSIAEALLLLRHTDKSDRGPGLRQLINQARQQKLFARDTLRHLETLADYRDLIHPRAEKRNQTFRNEARVDEAVTALKLLCVELEDPEVRYE